MNEYGPFKSIGLIKQMYIVYDVARKGLGKLRMFWLKQEKLLCAKGCICTP